MQQAGLVPFIIRSIIWVSLVIGGVGLLFIIFTYYRVESVSDSFVFSSVDDLPETEVALVLGTSQFLSSGEENAYFSNRIEAAAQVYQAGKVKKLLVSGDNREVDYNEPKAMQEALIEKGIPKEDIVLDFAGRRTLDSVLRAERVFEQDRFIVISQPFHAERAVFIGRAKGIDIVGFEAEDILFRKSLRIHLREVLARAQAWVDVIILDKEPQFLGDTIDVDNPGQEEIQ